jgi:integrase
MSLSPIFDRDREPEVVRKKVDPGAVRALIEQLQGVLDESREQVAPTVDELWEAYEPAARRLDSYSTLTGRMRHVLAFFGAMRADQVGLSEVERYRQERTGQITVRGRTTAPATRNREIESLIRLLHWATLHKKIPGHQLNRLPKGEVYEREDNVRRTIISEAQLEALCRPALPWLRAAILIARDSGMRRGEIVAIRWDQINFKLGLIFIDAADTKTVEARATMLSRRAAEAIKALDRDKRSTYVFASQRSRTGHYEKSNFSQAFRKLCDETGVRGPDGNVWLHDGRRTFITRARHAGVDSTEIQKMSGHRTMAAFKRYNIINPADVVRARATIEAANEEELELLRSQRRPAKKIDGLAEEQSAPRNRRRL